MRKLLAAIGFILLASPAFAGVTCSLPFTLTNGTIADATQVMANYDALVTCLTNAASAGANNDITSLSGLTTPITPNQGGSNVFLGASPTVSGNEIIIGSTTPSAFAYTPNYTVVFLAPGVNSGAVQINVNNQGIVNLYKQSTSGPVPLTGGELQTGQTVWAAYDGTEFQINPVPSIAAGWGLSQNASATALQINATNPPYGAGKCINLSLAASVPTANILQISLNAADTGSAPTTAHPILCPFRDPTLANGDPQWIAITATNTINTNATGATLGTVNNVPFKLWLVAFNNGGTLVPALINTAITTPTASAQIFALNETTLQSAAGIGSGATSAGAFYAPNGTTITSKAFTILGNCEYSTGLTTAGSYASACTKLQLFGPGVKKPGDVIQLATNMAAGQQAGTASFATSPLFVAMTPSSTVNPIRVKAQAAFGVSTSAGFVSAQLCRTSASNLFGPVGLMGEPSTAVTLYGTISVEGYDQPATTSATTYYLCFKASTTPNVGFIFPTGEGGTGGIQAEEVEY